MMSLPFFGLFAGLALILAGRRGAAMLVWALSMTLLALLFRLHATDALNIAL
ncbi:hypothetical protein GCM10028812_45900 [Ancylobacter sonchi]